MEMVMWWIAFIVACAFSGYWSHRYGWPPAVTLGVVLTMAIGLVTWLFTIRI